MIKKTCVFCEKRFDSDSKKVKYCSEKCRQDGAREKQRQLMKRKRAEEKKSKSKKENPNKLTRKKRQKKKDWLKHYQKIKADILANELEFGYTGRTLVEGIDVHDSDFEKLVIEKIKEHEK